MSKLVRESLTPKQNFIYAVLSCDSSLEEISEDMLIVHDDFDEAFKYLEENVLTPKEVIAIRLYFLDGRNYRETALIMGLSNSRARQLVLNSIRKCRRYKNYFLVGYNEYKKKQEATRNGIGVDVDSIYLDELGLSNATCNVLKRAGCNTIGDIRGVSLSRILRIRNLGSVRFKELSDALEKLGITLE